MIEGLLVGFAIGAVIGWFVGYLIFPRADRASRLLCRVGLHRYRNGRKVGEYDSITGPRTIVKGECAFGCGATSRWTVRGEL